MDALPPSAVAQVVAKAEGASGVVSSQEAVVLLAAMRSKLPRTQIIDARPAAVAGLIELELEGGRIAYTDRTGRYLILGLMLDTVTGKFVPNSLEASQ